ncbi:unnamed protein product [Ixodes hexagonus]
MRSWRWNERGYGRSSASRGYSRRWIHSPGDLFEPPIEEYRGVQLRVMFVSLLVMGAVATKYYMELLPLLRGTYQEGYDKDRVAENETEPRAYSDRAGRAIEPHRAWTDSSEHWRSPYDALHVFSAFSHKYRKDAARKPHVTVTALLSPRLRYSCQVRARVVYQDYPHSFSTEAGVCRFLSSDDQEQSTANQSEVETLEPAVLEFPTDQRPSPSLPTAVPTAITVLLNGMDSQVWIPVRTSSIGPTLEAVGVCVSETNRDSASDMAEFFAFHQLIGATKFVVYATADIHHLAFLSPNNSEAKRDSLVAILPWYNSTVLLQTTPLSAKRLMLEDCLFRSKSSVEFVALMNANEFLVPRKVPNEARPPWGFEWTGTLADMWLVESATFCKNVRTGDGITTVSTLRSQSNIVCLNDFEWKPLIFRCSGPRALGTRQSRALRIPRKDFVLHKFESELACSAQIGYIDTAAQTFANELKMNLRYYYP